MGMPRIMTLLAVVGAVSACTSAKDYSKLPVVPTHTRVSQLDVTPQSVRSTAVLPAAPAVPMQPIRSVRIPPRVSTHSDRIAPQDLLTVSVYKISDLNRDVRVDNSGHVTLPLVGRIRASGMTTSQIEKQIASRLGRYMHSPQVSVFRKESSRNRITVEGEVRSAGVFPVNSNMTVLQAIALAGGLTEKGDPNQVILLRKNQRQPINLAAIRSGQRVDIPLAQDDRVVVLEKAQNLRVTIEGSVNSPGVYPIKGRMTVLQAIAMAGGLNRLANPNSAMLMRYLPNGQTQRYQVNLDAIRAGTAPDPQLAPDDRIVVTDSRNKVILDNARGLVQPIRLF